VKYELEKVIVTGEEFNSIRREEHIAYSDNYDELMEMAKTLPLKGSRHRREWFALLEIDEHGDITPQDEIFADDWRRRK